MIYLNFRDDGLYVLARKMGMDPGIGTTPGSTFLADLAQSYAIFLSLAVKKLHNRFDFPDFAIIEDRTPNSNNYVPLFEAATGIIDRVLKVYPRDPRVNYPPVDIPYRLDENGIHVGYDHGTKVWLKYLAPAPRYTTVNYSAIVTYNSRALVYLPGNGECYESQQNGNIGQSVSDPAWWKHQPFPESISDLIVRLAFADALREDGQFDKANLEEQGAIQEAVSRAASFVNTPFDTMTDQSRPASRYRPPGFNIPISSGGK